MRGIAVTSVCLAVGAFSCDVILTDIGGRREPCAEDGSCYGDLICVFDTCREMPGEGEECDVEQEAYDVFCADDLSCVDAECAEAGGEGEPCDPDWGECSERACDGELFCIDGSCVALGGEGQPCICEDESAWSDNCFVDCASLTASDDPQCDDGLVCEDDICAEP